MSKQKNESKKPLVDVQKLIQEECDYIKELLLKKNASYGNSAIEPIRIFSRCSADEAIRVRIDDKLSRIAYGHEYDDESTIDDLIGYLNLLKIQRAYQEKLGNSTKRIKKLLKRKK